MQTYILFNDKIQLDFYTNKTQMQKYKNKGETRDEEKTKEIVDKKNINSNNFNNIYILNI